MAIGNNFNAGRIPQPGISRQGINPNKPGLPERKPLSSREIEGRKEVAGTAPGQLKNIPQPALTAMLEALYKGPSGNDGLAGLLFVVEGASYANA